MFEMSDQVELWGNDESVLQVFGVRVATAATGASLRHDDDDSSVRDEL